jgi:pyrimidine-nucleoside phosphorylase
MRMYDIIAKKRDGGVLNPQEIEFAVNGFVRGDVPDYQMSALMMAIYLRGMSDAEAAQLTNVMARCGETVDLSAIQGVKADKHSTGGVGDKTTLVVAPIVAACGVKIAKMSGRGLGHTGGTIDKMESVPGTRTVLSRQEFFRQVNEIGIAVIGQSGQIAIADKKMYALRDVTATVGCIPLIASSIMSKKLASGSNAILLDVTVGSGAFMKDLDHAVELARLMVSIGVAHGREVAALITNMDQPLGKNIGNSLEVAESMEVLRGQGPEDLREVCFQLAANMLMLAGKGEPHTCRALVERAVETGAAFDKCKQMFAAQGGDTTVLTDASRFRAAKHHFALKAQSDGILCKNDAEKIGNASVLLGAGRIRKEDTINMAAGIVMERKLGDAVKTGQTLCTFYADDPALFAPAEQMYRSGLVIGTQKPKQMPLVYARVTKNGIERF